MKAIILAIILCESGFNPKAYNIEGRAKGLGQITPIAVKEANRVCGLPLNPNLFDPTINLLYTKCIYEHYRKSSRSDVEAMILYHGGYLGLRRFRRGKSPGPRTSKYVNRVLHFKERFENGKINLKYYCNKYVDLPDSICKSLKGREK